MFLEQHSLAIHISTLGILLYFGELAHILVLLQKNGINLRFFVTDQSLIHYIPVILFDYIGQILGMLTVYCTSRPGKCRSLLMRILFFIYQTSIAYFIGCRWPLHVLGGLNHLIPFFNKRHILQAFFLMVNIYYFFGCGIYMPINILIPRCRAASRP